MNNPEPYTLIHAIGSKDKYRLYQLCWDPDYKQFIEPITNKPAVPLIGAIIYWEYAACLKTNLLPH